MYDGTPDLMAAAKSAASSLSSACFSRDARATPAAVSCDLDEMRSLIGSYRLNTATPELNDLFATREAHSACIPSADDRAQASDSAALAAAESPAVCKSAICC